MQPALPVVGVENGHEGCGVQGNDDQTRQYQGYDRVNEGHDQEDILELEQGHAEGLLNTFSQNICGPESEAVEDDGKSDDGGDGD